MLILFTGKGGVGKSTISATTAVHHASQGKKTILVSSDPAHSTDDVIGQKIGFTKTMPTEHISRWCEIHNNVRETNDAPRGSGSRSDSHHA